MSLRQPDVEATGTVRNHNVRIKLFIVKEDNPSGTPEELAKLPQLSNKAVHCTRDISIG